MCELFGASSKEELCLNEYLKVFFSHSVEHPDGWGLAFLEGNASMIEKEPLCANKSRYLQARMSQEIYGRNVFAHIRYATIGNVEFENCHPMTKVDNSGRRWTFMHNGTIFDYPPLYPYTKKQTGDTDSERVMLYLIDRINEESDKKGAPLSDRERFYLLDEIISDMAAGNKLNLLIYDGNITYVHTNYKNSLYYLQKDADTVLFSTKPLTSESWQPLPFMTLLAWQDGKRVFTGNKHENEYFDNAENMKMIYQIFSNL